MKKNYRIPDATIKDIKNKDLIINNITYLEEIYTPLILIPQFILFLTPSLLMLIRNVFLSL